MPKVRVHNVSISLDGYMAGPKQTLDEPLGVGGEQLHEWMFKTKTGVEMFGSPGPGTTGIDDDFVAAGDKQVGATIMGRNMFGPVRGEWGDSDWTGWWGEEPPYHHPVYVLTRHPHPPIEMQGGTTFYFVTDGIASALDRALTAADGADVRVGGGASTIRQYLRAGAIDELHVVISPVFLGGGERIFDNVGRLDGYKVTEMVSSTSVVHVRMSKAAPAAR